MQKRNIASVSIQVRSLSVPLISDRQGLCSDSWQLHRQKYMAYMIVYLIQAVNLNSGCSECLHICKCNYILYFENFVAVFILEFCWSSCKRETNPSEPGESLRSYRVATRAVAWSGMLLGSVIMQGSQIVCCILGHNTLWIHCFEVSDLLEFFCFLILISVFGMITVPSSMGSDTGFDQSAKKITVCCFTTVNVQDS